MARDVRQAGQLPVESMVFAQKRQQGWIGPVSSTSHAGQPQNRHGRAADSASEDGEGGEGGVSAIFATFAIFGPAS
jgi:hypothetical protein